MKKNLLVLLLIAVFSNSFAQKNDIWVSFYNQDSTKIGFKDKLGNVKIEPKFVEMYGNQKFENIIATIEEVGDVWKSYYLTKSGKKVGENMLFMFDNTPDCENEGFIRFTDEKLEKTGLFGKDGNIATCLFKRGLKNQFIQDVKPLQLGKPNMVGEAYTLRCIPAREDRNPISVFRNPEHPQRVAVENCPPNHILVIDSRKKANAASGGDILISRLMMRGVAGVVTDGGFRDSTNIAKLSIPAYHNRPSAPTNLTLHEALDINVPIGCGDVAVFPGDILVGDDDGVMVIPAEIVDEVADECTEMTLFENFVLEKVLAGNTIIGLYPPTKDASLSEFDEWKKSK